MSESKCGRLMGLNRIDIFLYLIPMAADKSVNRTNIVTKIFRTSVRFVTTLLRIYLNYREFLQLLPFKVPSRNRKENTLLYLLFPSKNAEMTSPLYVLYRSENKIVRLEPSKEFARTYLIMERNIIFILYLYYIYVIFVLYLFYIYVGLLNK